MARLKIRIRFNPGRDGAPMDKLGEFTSQSEKFLRSLTADLGVDAKKGLWLSSRFGNESVGWDAEYAGALRDAEALQGNEALEAILGDNTLSAIERGLVSYGTVAQFSRIGESLEPSDFFYMGVYKSPDAQEPDWKKVTYRKTAELRQLLDAPYNTAGTVQGLFHSWHQGADKPFFNVRELSTGNLIHCDYEPELYAKIHQAMEAPDTIVLVYGEMRWDRATSSIIALSVSDIEAVKPLTPHEFEKLVGIAPTFTGTMSTDEYISWLRGDEE